MYKKFELIYKKYSLILKYDFYKRHLNVRNRIIKKWAIVLDWFWEKYLVKIM